MTAEDSKRLADIRATYYGGVYGNSPGAVDVPWLLDQLAARDARIAKMEAALETISDYSGDMCDQAPYTAKDALKP